MKILRTRRKSIIKNVTVFIVKYILVIFEEIIPFVKAVRLHILFTLNLTDARQMFTG
jgi:hypothetical protein